MRMTEFIKDNTGSVLVRTRLSPKACRQLIDKVLPNNRKLVWVQDSDTNTNDRIMLIIACGLSSVSLWNRLADVPEIESRMLTFEPLPESIRIYLSHNGTSMSDCITLLPSEMNALSIALSLPDDEITFYDCLSEIWFPDSHDDGLEVS